MTRQVARIQHKTKPISISIEQFALGALALYALNAFGGALIFVCFFLGAALFADIQTVIPRYVYLLFGFAIGCLLLIGIGAITFWGAKNFLRARLVPMLSFSVIWIACTALYAHLGVVDYFKIATSSLFVIIIILRWKRVFPQLTH